MEWLPGAFRFIFKIAYQMTGIQFILLGGIISIFLYYFLKLRSAFIDLLIVSIFSLLGIFFIFSPESTTVLATAVGVGRGADLLFYSCILFFLFIILKLVARIKRLELKFTELVREIAAEKAMNMSHDKQDEVTEKEKKD